MDPQHWDGGDITAPGLPRGSLGTRHEPRLSVEMGKGPGRAKPGVPWELETAPRAHAEATQDPLRPSPHH